MDKAPSNPAEAIERTAQQQPYPIIYPPQFPAYPSYPPYPPYPYPSYPPSYSPSQYMYMMPPNEVRDSSRTSSNPPPESYQSSQQPYLPMMPMPQMYNYQAMPKMVSMMYNPMQGAPLGQPPLNMAFESPQRFPPPFYNPQNYMLYNNHYPMVPNMTASLPSQPSQPQVPVASQRARSPGGEEDSGEEGGSLQSQEQSDHPAERACQSTCFCNNQIFLLKQTMKEVETKVMRCVNDNCSSEFHQFCMKVCDEATSLRVAPSFECTSCVLAKLDPFSRVLRTIIEPQIVIPECQKFFLSSEMYKQIMADPNKGLELRCITVDLNADSISWPDFGQLFFNEKKMRSFTPLCKEASQAKRKDTPLFLREELRQGDNTIRICELVYTMEEKRRLHIQENQLYQVGLYLVQRRTPESLLQHIFGQHQKSQEQCQFKMVKTLEQLDLEEKELSLLDPFDRQLLNIPARGRFCKHIECFSLANFIDNMYHIKARRWLCPICRKKMFDIEIDQFMEKILVTARDLGHPASQAIIRRDGSYYVPRELVAEPNTPSEEEPSLSHLNGLLHQSSKTIYEQIDSVSQSEEAPSQSKNLASRSRRIRRKGRSKYI